MHFSDLHYGQLQQNILLPRLKKELFRDLGELVKEIGTIDVVFFTGDLTFSGKKDEFDALTVFLEELWNVFRKLDCDPYFIAIPGNHDLFRPDPKDPAVKVLSKYSEEAETRTEFWSDIQSGNEHYKVINECIKNFGSWYKNTGIRKPAIIDGLLPGDLAATVTIEDIVLKVIGLNSAFLEFRNGDYLGKLAIHPCQLNAVAKGDPIKWVEEADISLLLTHHDPNWYFSESLKCYNEEINSSGTTCAVICMSHR